MSVTLPPRPNWLQLIKSGNRVFLGGNAGVPYALIDDLIEHSKGLSDIELVHMLALGDTRWAKEEYRQLFKVNTFFIHGEEVRLAVDQGRADYTPVFLSEMSSLFSDGTLPLDAALVMVSPPDEFGYCSLGVSETLACLRYAKLKWPWHKLTSKCREQPGILMFISVNFLLVSKPMSHYSRSLFLPLTASRSVLVNTCLCWLTTELPCNLV